MICSTCKNSPARGFILKQILFSSPVDVASLVPCPDCDGSGIASCCDTAGSPGEPDYMKAIRECVAASK